MWLALLAAIAADSLNRVKLAITSFYNFQAAMSTNFWHKLWKFLNQPLFVKRLDLDNIPYCEPIEYPDLSWTEDYLLRETQLTVDSFSYKRQVEYLEHCLGLDASDSQTCDR